MSCKINPKEIKKTIDFHGHSCPGLAIGIRASELAMEKLNINAVSAPLCVTETDMCGVDAIQYLTPCTFGKGNLVHRDFGKAAFTFFDRDSGKGFRAVFQSPVSDEKMPEREDYIKLVIETELKDLFRVTDVDAPPVTPARILKSITCTKCGEKTMESRIRLFNGEKLCFPCFQKVEQKI